MKVNIKKIIVIAVALILAINLSSCALITQVRNSSTNSNNPLFSHNPPFDPYSSGLVLDDLNIDEAVFVSNSDEFYTHLEMSIGKRHRSIFVRSSSHESFPDLGNLDRYSFKGCYKTVYSSTNGTYYAIYEIEYYPGDSVLYAYQNNDKSLLNKNELELYELAIDFINNSISSQMSDFDKEIIIHDYICETLSYQREGTDDSDTYNITGAYSLITGFANCQGYTDAFYMLTNMAGIKCHKVSGEAQQTAHTWNVVNIDGRWSYADVTFDDTAFDNDGVVFYAYCNVPREYLEKSHIFYDNQTLFQTEGYEDFYYTRKGKAVFNEDDFRQLVYLPISEGTAQIKVFIMLAQIQPLLDTLKDLNKSMQLSYFMINECTLLDINVQ
ncbi:MAG TPA: transglutaminase domain-containing protein [Clostridia bacterium]|nr:transglutaminase domain-containing protein [Clostridia bacterium]